MPRSTTFAFAALICAVSVAAVGAQTINNPLSQFEITTDGLFTGGIGAGGTVLGEWSDVTSQGFSSAGGSLHPTPASSSTSLLFAANEGDPGDVDLYLLYDYALRTDTHFGPGDFIADIKFPITQNNIRKNITVNLRGAAPNGNPVLMDSSGSGSGSPVPNSFFDVFVDIDSNGTPDAPAASVGMEAGVGFGPSPLGPSPHMHVELEVPLLIPDGFGGPTKPFGEHGQPGGVYSPDPAFWGADSAKDAGDPPISSGIFEILPDASLNITPLPEPSTFVLAALAGLIGGAGMLRRRMGVR